MASTGTIQDEAAQVIFNKAGHRLTMTAVNDSGARLNPGTEVILKSNGTLDKRDAGTEFPLGVVEIGADNGNRPTVSLNGNMLMEVAPSTGTINAGTFVKPNGTVNAAGYPVVVAAVAGDYASMLVVKQATAPALIKVLVLHSPFQINPA